MAGRGGCRGAAAPQEVDIPAPVRAGLPAELSHERAEAKQRLQEPRSAAADKVTREDGDGGDEVGALPAPQVRVTAGSVLESGERKCEQAGGSGRRLFSSGFITSVRQFLRGVCRRRGDARRAVPVIYRFGGGNQNCSCVHRCLSSFQGLHRKGEESVAGGTVD